MFGGEVTIDTNLMLRKSKSSSKITFFPHSSLSEMVAKNANYHAVFFNYGQL